MIYDSMTINFKKNGFEVIKKDKRTFISYQSIIIIENITTRKYWDTVCSKWFELPIHLNSKQKVTIQGNVVELRSHCSVNKNNMKRHKDNWKKCGYNIPYCWYLGIYTKKVTNPRLQKFTSEDNYLAEKQRNEMKTIRKDIISHFNRWNQHTK